MVDENAWQKKWIVNVFSGISSSNNASSVMELRVEDEV